MDEPTGERSRAATIFNIVMMLVGGGALYLILRQHGWGEFRAMLDNVGWWFALVLGLELASLCMDAAAIHAFMRPEAGMIILFPSYLQHSVRMYHGERPRISVPFNAHMRVVSALA